MASLEPQSPTLTVAFTWACIPTITAGRDTIIVTHDGRVYFGGLDVLGRYKILFCISKQCSVWCECEIFGMGLRYILERKIRRQLGEPDWAYQTHQ